MNFTQQPCKNTQRLFNSLPSKINNKISSTRVENAIFRVISAPERWPIVEGEIRRYLTIKFSYFILYRVDPDRIVIAAIASCRRDPNYWQERL